MVVDRRAGAGAFAERLRTGDAEAWIAGTDNNAALQIGQRKGPLACIAAIDVAELGEEYRVFGNAEQLASGDHVAVGREVAEEGHDHARDIDAVEVTAKAAGDIDQVGDRLRGLIVGDGLTAPADHGRQVGTGQRHRMLAVGSP
jgi:hypothetical protein